MGRTEGLQKTHSIGLEEYNRLVQTHLSETEKDSKYGTIKTS